MLDDLKSEGTDKKFTTDLLTLRNSDLSLKGRHLASSLKHKIQRYVTMILNKTIPEDQTQDLRRRSDSEG